MRQIGDQLRAHLEEGATTLCHAWRVTRRDGVVLGFTDHDRDLVFAETTFLAASGFAPSDWETLSGLSAPSGEVAGALSSDAISEADIAAGRYDGSEVEQFLVNWADPTQHFRLRVMDIGEITRSGSDFRAELRSVAHRLGQGKSRIYAHRCDAAFGDARCGKDISSFTAEGTIIATADPTRITASGLDGFASGHFRYGALTFTSGANHSVSVDIESHTRSTSGTGLVLWLPLPNSPSVGDTFTIVAGCDKGFETCKSRFANAANFRGFPHMPGQDFAYSYADGETEHDGSPLYD
jgi:uncharacterized phage protein (TIGR02218 family)